MATLCWNWQPLDGIPLFPLWFSSLCFVACLWGMLDPWAKIMLYASYFLPGIWPGWCNQPTSLNKSPRLWILWGELMVFQNNIEFSVGFLLFVSEQGICWLDKGWILSYSISIVNILDSSLLLPPQIPESIALTAYLCLRIPGMENSASSSPTYFIFG